MDHIDEVLTSNAGNRTYSTAIRSALKVGKKTLNRYYSKTDMSETYRIAMGEFMLLQSNCLLTRLSVLHPRHKLAYFRHAGWSADWIKTAETLVRTAYEQKYQDFCGSDMVSRVFRCTNMLYITLVHDRKKTMMSTRRLPHNPRTFSTTFPLSHRCKETWLKTK